MLQSYVTLPFNGNKNSRQQKKGGILDKPTQAKAKRGDLAAIELTRSATFLQGGTQAKKVFAIARIDGVSRDGRIIRYRVAGAHQDSKNTPARSWIISQDAIRTADAFAAINQQCAAQWDANEFSSTEDVRAFLLAYKGANSSNTAPLPA